MATAGERPAGAGERPVLRDRAAADRLVLDVLREHAESLLRVARRHSLCQDDAHDAYQRAVEIFLRHAPRLRADDAHKWIHTVTKHEAMAVRASRLRLVGSEEADLDASEAADAPEPEERAMRFERLQRSAEALQRLKPQELQALWLKAQGHSYQEIAELQGWTYTKVNRCLTEGRKSFLERYAGIEAGAECGRWEAVLCAMADGEATPAQLTELRPHLRNCRACRATLRAMRESQGGLAAVLPVPALAAVAAAPHAAPHAEATGSLFARACDWATESAFRLQGAVEAASGAKVAAVAASAAAIAGGGVAVQRVVTAPPRPHVAAGRSVGHRLPAPTPRARPAAIPAVAAGARSVARPPARPRLTPRARAHVTRTSEFGLTRRAREARASQASTAAREFATGDTASATAASSGSGAAAPAPAAAPARSSPATRTAAAEFGG